MTGLAEELRRRVGEAAREAVRETAARLAARAANKTPVRTGRLRDGWRVSSTPGQEGTEKGLAGLSAESDTTTLYVVNFTPYALRVELGDLGRPGRFMAARALEESAGELGRNLAARLGRTTLTQRSQDLDSEPLGQPVEPEEIAGNASGDGPDRNRTGP